MINLKKLDKDELANLGMEICECAPCDILSAKELEIVYSGFADNTYETDEDEQHLLWLAKEHPLLIIKCLVGSARQIDANGRHEPDRYVEGDGLLGVMYGELLLNILA